MSAAQQCNLYIRYGCWCGLTQHQGGTSQNPGAERLHLERMWGGSTLDGSPRMTMGRIDRKPKMAFDLKLSLWVG